MRRRQLLPLPWWLNNDLLFWAPLRDVANPLVNYRGTGPCGFTRATTALRFTGIRFVSVDAGVLRIEPFGARIEEARQNLFLYADTSQDLLDQWTKAGLTAVFENDAAGYGGKRWSLAADGSDRQFVRSIAIAAAAHSVSFYVRRPDGAAVTAADCIIHREGADQTSTYTLVGNGIYRVSEANITGSGGAAATGLTVKADATIHLVAPPTLEAGSFPLSPIPTEDSAITRNADALSILVSGNLDPATGTAVVDFRLPADTNWLVPILGGTGGNPAYFYSDAELVKAYDGSGLFTFSPVMAGVRHRLAAFWGGGQMGIVVDGGAVNTAAFDGDVSIGANLLLGSSGVTGGGSGLNLFDLRIFGRKLSAAELQNITR